MSLPVVCLVASSAACMAVAVSSQYVVREARATCTRGERDSKQVVSLGHIQVMTTREQFS